MPQVIINSIEEWEKLNGQELGVSEWINVSQEKINKFAEATEDYQWIHTDPEKAAKESPFKTTIAHGYLTLSLIPALIEQVLKVNNSKLAVNYGVEQLRFSEPVPSGSDVRLKLSIKEIKNLRGIMRVKFGVSLEIADKQKPAYNGTTVYLYHY
jgi:acyl dehydratase